MHPTRVDDRDLVCNNEIYFDNYYIPSSNQSHIFLNTDNVNWLTQEIDNNLQNCVRICPPLSISGDNAFCPPASNIYSINNLPAGATVEWNTTPAGIAVPNTPYSTSTTLSRNSDGIITLQATITNACGGPNTITKPNIRVGAQGISLTSSANSCSGTYQSWFLNAIPSSSGSNWHWTVDYLGNGSDIYIFSPYASSTDIDVSGGGTVRLSYTDLCGATKTDGVTVYSNCYNGEFAYSISPNPTFSNLQVSSTDKKTNIKEIKITDKIGTIKKRYTYSENLISITINISSLPPDIYYIQIFDGKKWTSKAISKK